MQGRAYANRGEFERALVEFEQAIELDPGNPVFLNNMATSLARLNRFGEAGEGFAKVCELDPIYPNAAFFAAASFSSARTPSVRVATAPRVTEEASNPSFTTTGTRRKSASTRSKRPSWPRCFPCPRKGFGPGISQKAYFTAASGR